MSDPAYLERDGSIARLVMNRPEKKNALTFSDAEFLVDLLHQAEDDDDIKVIILKGAGDAFCVGHDFEDIVEVYKLNRRDDDGRYVRLSQRDRVRIDRSVAEVYQAFHYSAKPIIAQVHGQAVGFGVYLTELVDLCVCADDATFSHSEQRLGFAGNTWHLNTLLLQYGPKKTREMLLFGSKFDGHQAVEYGVANKAVPAGELESEVERWAERVCMNAKDALVVGKAIHQMALDSLGGSQQFQRGYVGHALGTNIKFEKDEFSFFRDRRDRGTKQAFRNRDARFESDD